MGPSCHFRKNSDYKSRTSTPFKCALVLCIWQCVTLLSDSTPPMLKHAQVKKQQHFLRECGCRESHSKNKKKISPMEDRETILKDVFGDSSSEEGSEHDKFDDPDRRATSGLAHGEIPSWERISQMDGLWLCKDFLSSDRQESLLSAINRGALFDSKTSSFLIGSMPRFLYFHYNYL